MRFHTIINIVITLTIIILGAFLGNTIHDWKYFTWVFFLLVYAVFIQILYNKNISLGTDLTLEKNKISAFFLTKSGESKQALQCLLFPKIGAEKIIKHNRIGMEVFVTSSTELQRPPEIKLSIDNECKIFIHNQEINQTKYAGVNVFYLSNYNSLINTIEDKYFKYYFVIEFLRNGECILRTEANNGETMLEVSNMLTVSNKK